MPLLMPPLRPLTVSLLLALPLALLAAAPVHAQSARGWDDSAANLMVVLRESRGANKTSEGLVPSPKVKAWVPDRGNIEIANAWFEVIGDMHLRFVFDTPNFMPNATPEDLQRLGLSPEAALDLALQNIRRVYGEPKATPWTSLMQVQGRSPDLDSSYFLDRVYWNGLLQRHPEGLVAAVVKRGGLLYAPLADARGVELLRRAVGELHATSDSMRISSALYLFKDGRWSVFQAPVGAKAQ